MRLLRIHCGEYMVAIDGIHLSQTWATMTTAFLRSQLSLGECIARTNTGIIRSSIRVRYEPSIRVSLTDIATA